MSSREHPVSSSGKRDPDLVNLRSFLKISLSPEYPEDRASFREQLSIPDIMDDRQAEVFLLKRFTSLKESDPSTFKSLIDTFKPMENLPPSSPFPPLPAKKPVPSSDPTLSCNPASASLATIRSAHK